MAEKISTPSKTKEIIEKYNFYFKKNFGQNFLIDGNVLDNIISAAKITKDDFVLEIGPGIGSLTQYLAENAGKVLAVEIDKNLIPILGETLKEYDNVEIINEDVLKIDINSIIEEKNNGKPIKVVANLPYYITTPILMELLERRLNVESITVMVQKEVADRMQAQPKTKDYGALTLAVQYYSHANINFIVPPGCFMPRPNVDSAVITLTIHKGSGFSVENEDLMFEIIKASFAQRRKTLLNGLNNAPNLKFTKEDVISALNEMGIDERIRGEALSVEDFANLSNILNKKM